MLKYSIETESKFKRNLNNRINNFQSIYKFCL